LRQAKAAIRAGEKSWCEAAKLIAAAQEQGATQTQIAMAVGRSQAWVNELLQWHKAGCKDVSPFTAKNAKRKLSLSDKSSADDYQDHLADGKNFSANNCGQRKQSDFYETPYSITRHLLDKEKFDYGLKVCEPACGAGAIVKVLKERWCGKVVSFDLQTGTDFLRQQRHYDYLITNPPFSLADEFIQHAKKVASKQFALLLPLNYLHGGNRFLNVYSDRTYGLKKVYVFTRYPLLGEPLCENGKYHTGMMVYAWYVFENGYSELPRIDWIDNSKDILNANDVAIAA
jgi:hypothetical protein